MRSPFYQSVISWCAGLIVTVTTSTGCSNIKSADGSDESITLLEVTPDKAPLSGGMQVVLTGSGFEEGANVMFGGLAATDIHGESNNLYATVPAFPGPLGPVEIAVQNPSGSSVRRADLFSYVRVPVTFEKTVTRPSGRHPTAMAAADA